MSCEDRLTDVIDKLIYHQDLLVSQNDGSFNKRVRQNNIMLDTGHIGCQDIGLQST